MVKKIWYPGSAYASTKWATYLQNTFKGTWYYSDIVDFTEWNHLKGVRIKADTFGELPDKLLNEKIDILIISRHPGLKSGLEVIESGILEKVNPNVFVYDPGADVGNLSQHLEVIESFNYLGYKLDKIVVLPDLYHQYCEFRKITENE